MDPLFSTPRGLMRKGSITMAAVALLVISMTVSNPIAAASVGNSSVPEVSDPQATENLDVTMLATMRRQEKLEPALQALGDAQLGDLQSGFAGFAFEGEGLTVYWKGDLAPAMAGALERARGFGPVTVRTAAFSEAELKGAARKIAAVMKARGATDIQSITFNPDGSGLEVSREPADHVAELANARAAKGKPELIRAEQIVAEARISVPVRLSTATDRIALMVTRGDDFAAWNGGSRWEAWRGLDFRGACTTGFGVHAGSRSFVLSAGHCASPPDYAFQGYSSYTGTSKFENMGPVFDDDWRSDLLLIDAPGWYKIFDGSPTTSVTKKVNSWGYWAKDQLVCHSGMISGTIWGLKQVKSGNYNVSCSNPDSDGDCNYVIEGLIETTQIDGATAVRSGDSGSPVFTLDGSGVRAKGIVSAGSGTKMYFQDWADVIRVFGAYPNTSSTTS
ncbi:hypothetical protein Cme02nite_07320 [Catellatospora methionotrophica]|uniref:Trypsin-like serine protease n=1 Tax=Catellatospora methionotrophica TaxID=121620 RepID=A0A8J3LD38_9ACTN|nr:trypsin-like serine protease [Catellatospora methionotrophica]GIG12400.1 hypothetical protein Cme02nite_07320 [Catellatospora methionotrophica]